MHHKNTIGENTALLIVDLQEAFRDVIPNFPMIATAISRAANGFGVLGLPVLVTEQYPKGLGPTAEEVMLSLPDNARIFEKSSFSALGAEEVASALAESGSSNVVLCGLETHICVDQTAHELLESGYKVHLLLDCIGSRFEIDKAAGLEKMRSSGVISSSVEMALFEIMGSSKHPRFKEIQTLIK